MKSMISHRSLTMFLALITFLLLAELAPVGAATLIVYSGRKERAIKPVIDAFVRESGIRVRLRVGKTGGLINQLIQERSRPRADVFIATTAGAVEAVLDRDLFEPYVSPQAAAIASRYKSSKGLWTGISGRARILMYNSRALKPSEVPTSVLDLGASRWRGKLAIAATRERTTLGWLSALVATLGKQKARAAVQALLDNAIKILPDNTDVRRAVGNGEVLLGLTNSPNYHLTKAEGMPVGVVFPDQGPGQMGVLVNPNTVSIVKGTKHRKEAKRMVDFLLSPAAARLLIQKSYEIPLRSDVKPTGVKGLQDFRSLDVTQEKLGKLAQETLELFPEF